MGFPKTLNNTFVLERQEDKLWDKSCTKQRDETLNKCGV